MANLEVGDFWIPTAVMIKIHDFWDVTSCQLTKSYPHFKQRSTRLEGQTHDCLTPKVLCSSEMLVALIRPHTVLLINIQCAIFLTIQLHSYLEFVGQS